MTEETKKPVNASEIAQDIVKMIGEKYPGATIGDIEFTLAFIIYDLEDRLVHDSPEHTTVPMENTLNDMMYMAKGNQNTIIRIGADVLALSARIKEILKAQEEANKKEDEKK